MRLALLLTLWLSPVLAHGQAGEPAWVKRYATLTSVSARIVQTKQAPYLLKELRSEIDFAYDGKTIHWNVTSPIQKNISIKDDGDTWSVGPAAGTSPAPAMPVSMRQFGKLLFAILRWDRAFLSQGHEITWEERPDEDRAAIRPKTATSFAGDIDLHFSRAGDLKKVVLRNGDEVTTMNVIDWQARAKG